ncbi:MAG: PAS domain S-box protein, partial [Deltaproteobacteria bacterium]
MRVLWTNRAAGDSVGADPQQLVGRHCYEVWQQGSKPCVGCPVAMARKSGRPQEAEMTSPDGRVWFVRGYPVRDKKGKVIGAVEVTLEITESKQAEEALRKSEEKYRTVVELSPDGIAIASKGRHVFANKSLAKIFGVSSPDDLLGKPLMDYIHPDYRKAVGRRIEQQTKRGELVPLIEEKMLRADGTVIHTEVTAAPLEYEGEQAVLAAIRDITERKRAEEELRESEERFRMVLESSVDNLYRRNLQTNTYDYISPSVERISGYSSEEMRSMSLESVVSMMHPADIERSKCVLEESMASDSGTCLLEYRFRHKDGQYRWLSDLFTVVRDAQGRPLYLVGNVRDITERKRADEALRASEERFRTIFEAARDFIFLKDRDSKFTAVNPAMEQIYGVPASRLIGKTAKVLFGKEMAVRFREQDVRILNGETIIEEHPSPLKGSTAIHHVIKVPMRNSAGEIIGLCGIGRDITERKQMEEALRESEERFRTIVEQAAEAILAHDLDGRVLLVNSLTCEYTGYSREELLSMNALDLDHKILEKDYKRKYWEKLQIGKYVKVEAIHMRKDGSSYPAEVYLVKIMFKSQPIILCLARDITERKKAEEQLRESEERFRALFEGAPDAIFLADPESGRILDANPAASHLLLRPHEEIVGLHQSQLHPSHMEGQIKEAFVDDIRQFKQGKELRSIESAVMRSDRSEVPVEILGHMVSINGRPVLQGTFRDITERKKAEEALKKSEEKYRLLSENIPVAVYSALPDEHSTNLFLSGQFLELTGYPIEHFFKDPKLWSSLLHPEDRDYVWEK